ncbi:MAG: LCP family protein [Caldilineaceae bacterium]|nr:LCP family protein [Caldilineaceae bacterium]
MTERNVGVPATAAVAPQPEHTDGWRALGLALLLFVLVVLGLSTAFWWWTRTAPPANFMIAGVDQDAGATEPTRTDVVMLLHTNLPARDVGLISIPRDLWLPQPNGVTERVNRALAAGYDPANPDAGPRFLEQTLADSFDVAFDGYLLLNFDSFVAVVDAVGGVEVDLAQTIVDEAYPDPVEGLRTVRFEAGHHILDGETALTYVRTRDQGSDFGRADRQQQVFEAVVTKALQPRHWLRLPAVAFAVLRNVQTDLTYGQLSLVGWAAVRIARGQVDTLTFDQNYVDPWYTPNGTYTVLPRWDVMRPAVDEILHRAEN